jgi:hypothetical protein
MNKQRNEIKNIMQVMKEEFSKNIENLTKIKLKFWKYKTKYLKLKNFAENLTKRVEKFVNRELMSETE